MSIAVENMAERIQAIHEDVKKHLEESNAKYKEYANKHNRLKVFQEGDMLMVHLRK